MRMLADRKGCVFDVPNDKVELVEELWKDGYSASLAQADELPPLYETNAGKSGKIRIHKR